MNLFFAALVELQRKKRAELKTEAEQKNAAKSQTSTSDIDSDAAAAAEKAVYEEEERMLQIAKQVCGARLTSKLNTSHHHTSLHLTPCNADQS